MGRSKKTGWEIQFFKNRVNGGIHWYTSISLILDINRLDGTFVRRGSLNLGSSCKLSRIIEFWANEIHPVVFGDWRKSMMYPLVNKHSYWKWPFIVDVPIKHGDFPRYPDNLSPSKMFGFQPPKHPNYQPLPSIIIFFFISIGMNPYQSIYIDISP